MVENLKSTVEVLKQRIKFNLNLIHEIELEIKEILKEPVSKERSEKLDRRFNINKQIIKENNEAIKLQKSIIEFLKSYHDELSQFPETIKVENPQKTIALSKKIELKREDYFELTVNKDIEYDDQHPYFKDESFAKDLISYFIEVEDYEMCAKLVSLKDNS